MALHKEKRLEDIWQWKYDHVLTDEEEKNEVFFNKEMQTSYHYEFKNTKYNDIYWLLTEWRANTPLLLQARKHKDMNRYNILLSHRLMLNYHLNAYLRKTLGAL